MIFSGITVLMDCVPAVSTWGEPELVMPRPAPVRLTTGRFGYIHQISLPA
jgi:hypothetical protein